VDLYTFSLLLGAAGLGTMALLGFAHSHAGGQSHSHSAPHGHGPGHAHAHSHGHGHGHGHSHAHGNGHSIKEVGARTLWALISPRVIFSLVLGFGMVGLVARSFLEGLLLLGVAVAGGIAFERLIVTPIWNFTMRFASAPALTLESCVTEEATAVTSFDGKGQGLIAVELDGHLVQVLGTLKAGDRAAGIRVRAGDRVRIEEVDSERNRCTVSAL
jgi:hypothetical protein